MHQSWGILTPASLYLNRIDRELIKKEEWKNERLQNIRKYLIDIIKEEQAKLGYRKEKIRFYYPLSSLNNMFSSQDNVYEMAERLKKLSEYTNETLGEINVSNKADRFCFYISEQGVEYVHNNTKEDEFIKKLIEWLESMKQRSRI